MFMKFTKVAAAAAALAALPGVAQAGTSTASGTASFSVVSQCSITGATVNLGTYTVNNTFQDVGNKLGYGYYNVGTERVGTNGYEGITWGKVTCDIGTPYQILINGTHPDDNGIKLNIGDKSIDLTILVKSIGGNAVPVIWGWGGGTDWGTIANGDTFDVAGVGTGVEQLIKGSAPIYFDSTGSALATDKLGVAGTYTDTLTYTMNF